MHSDRFERGHVEPESGPQRHQCRTSDRPQRAYVAGDPLARYVTAESLELQEDEVHLTRAGYATLAARVAAVLR